MIYDGSILSIYPGIAGSVRQLMAAPRPKSNAAPPSGTRIGYVALTGVLEPDYMLERRLRIARLAEDDSVRAISLYVDSPGGTVAGTAELAEVVKRATAVKPVHVVAQNLLCSAAYHVASQATTITVSPSTLCGSIGTILALVDASEMFKSLGIRVIPITTGVNKMAGMPGVPAADDQVAMLQRLVDTWQMAFEVAVEKGRRLDRQQLDAVSDGSVWAASRAQKLGLVDQIALPEDRWAVLERKTPAEQFTELKYEAALSKWNELLCKEGKVEAHWDAPALTVARLQRKYPKLATHAAEEAQRQSHRARSRAHY